MKCPVCDGQLRAVDKYGVEIDICPDCKGVWLDRGELEKILSMAEKQDTGYSTHPAAPQQTKDDFRVKTPQHYDHDDDHDRHGYNKDYKHDHDHDDRYGHKKRKGSWLSDLFD